MQSVQVPAPAPSAQSVVPALRPQREMWTAPNNVSIEEGFANIGVGSHAANMAPGYSQYSAPPAGHQPSQPQYGGQYASQGFQAQAPVEAPRSSRRMPSVEDFPAVGQREWYDKQPSGTVAAANATDDRRKTGFFSRIGSIGRKSPDNSKSAAADSQGLAQSYEPDAPLPVFFGRERR